MISLLIDTSNRPLSVAINKDGYCQAEINTTVKKTHSATLMVYINELFKMTGYKREDIDRIIVARGPGSYTGVRIGVTIAKTLAHALNIPLYSVSSLAVIAASSGREGITAPMFDGRRGNVYTAIYQLECSTLEEVMDAGYMKLEAVLDSLKAHDGGVVLADAGEKFSSGLETFTHAVPRISSVEKFTSILRQEDVHQMVPEYLKVSEAEKNWMERTQS
ncbi:tRNA (adenosine(37)-N6)-threonylcarbamoyltransferase complex dimerization subunit type 1 TsaB [Salinicoccus roseus]|jgi:tRNA threonylcarbamoyl adenosine modification protein YeaZ|uniref:tRNA (adenosine(37)-N6)-threonylcarbamoyltransferase complex dimerization subunit type 1 TsaB n=1 Tax=Salinicoccus roseus TaxID=45670 RepID=UPI001EF57E77|nr:tRNA (adenosine(37)-N6)-threonylcarbamoyltransferase complex dimerization subunit type 1 TsaB [Salinicoccus roseus]MCG7333604.1 tRNA (adenosine(37)-N6)-threonylcarbamoyltransferase complex dimerization subunit type 1 TsaB [Salinicoccus roseus]